MKQAHFNKLRKKRAKNHYDHNRHSKDLAQKCERKGVTYHL